MGFMGNGVFLIDKNLWSTVPLLVFKVRWIISFFCLQELHLVHLEQNQSNVSLFPVVYSVLVFNLLSDRIVHFPWQMSEAKVQHVLQEAFGVWSAVTPLRFREVTSDKADIIIDFNRYRQNCSGLASSQEHLQRQFIEFNCIRSKKVNESENAVYTRVSVCVSLLAQLCYACTGTGMVTTYPSMVLEGSLPTLTSPGPTDREKSTLTMTSTGQSATTWVRTPTVGLHSETSSSISWHFTHLLYGRSTLSILLPTH